MAWYNCYRKLSNYRSGMRIVYTMNYQTAPTVLLFIFNYYIHYLIVTDDDSACINKVLDGKICSFSFLSNMPCRSFGRSISPHSCTTAYAFSVSTSFVYMHMTRKTRKRRTTPLLLPNYSLSRTSTTSVLCGYRQQGHLWFSVYVIGQATIHQVVKEEHSDLKCKC